MQQLFLNFLSGLSTGVASILRGETAVVREVRRRKSPAPRGLKPPRAAAAPKLLPPSQVERTEISAGRFDLAASWIEIRSEYFPDRTDLDGYKLSWSTRARSAMLACCNVQSRTIRVAAILNRPDCFQYLPALLYHEMCHAALGKPRVVRGRRVIHGRDFKALEQRHPGIKELDRWIKTGGWHSVVVQARRIRRTAGRRR